MHPASRLTESEPLVREQRPVTALRGVGSALAARLQVLGVEQIQDLLFILPNRYEDRTRISEMGALRAGERAVIEGEVQLAEMEEQLTAAAIDDAVEFALNSPQPDASELYTDVFGDDTAASFQGAPR